MANYTLLMDCPDEKGIVYKVTGVLFEAGLNVDEQGEFVDAQNQHFYMRTRVSGEGDISELVQNICQVAPEGSRVSCVEEHKKKVVLLVTKEAHCLGDILIQHEYGKLDAEILAVIGNHADLSGLVEKFEIPFHHIPTGDLERSEHESRVTQVIESYSPEYLVLAKYMRVLTPEFVSEYTNRIVNIHHSFLPAFIGAKPYHRAFERGVKIIGATAHFVNSSLDEGPIISQDVIGVSHRHSVEDIIQAGRDIEKAVLARALRLVFNDRVMVYGNRTVIFD